MEANRGHHPFSPSTLTPAWRANVCIDTIHAADVTDPSSPVEVGFLDTPDRAFRPSLKAEGTPSESRMGIAGLLAAWEAFGQRPKNSAQALEMYLAYAGWRSNDNREAYETASRSSELGESADSDAVPSFPESLEIPSGLEEGRYRAAIGDAFTAD